MVFIVKALGCCDFTQASEPQRRTGFTVLEKAPQPRNVDF
jgi:hypothetical protein